MKAAVDSGLIKPDPVETIVIIHGQYANDTDSDIVAIKNGNTIFLL